MANIIKISQITIESLFLFHVQTSEGRWSRTGVATPHRQGLGQLSSSASLVLCLMAQEAPSVFQEAGGGRTGKGTPLTQGDPLAVLHNIPA